jgi:hypothetical protein
MVALRFSKEEFVHLGLRMASNWSEQTIENSSYRHSENLRHYNTDNRRQQVESTW